MTILLDFNEQDDEGRVIGLLEDLENGSAKPGEFVVAADREGNQCKARIDEVSRTKGVLYLTPILGTFESQV